jgi:phage recombination protein Bet
MSQALQTTPGTNLTWTPDQVSLLKRTICREATDDELKLFLHVVKRTGLDPFARQIYAVKRNNGRGGKEMVIQTGIDGFRLTAFRTNAYAGREEATFDYEENAPYPTRCKVTVYKIVQGVRCAFTATANWDEYYPGDAQGFMWRKMPETMLEKCTEAKALRMAFPAELSAIYSEEEMAKDRESGVRPDKEGVVGNGILVEPKPGDIQKGQWARYNVTELPLPEVRKLKEKLEAETRLDVDGQKLLAFICEYLLTMDQMDPEELLDDSGNIKCECGSDLKLSERKGVYYCPKFNDGGKHISPVPKAHYEQAVKS